MTLDMPNYMNSEDRRLYDELVKAGSERDLTKAERMFVSYMYHQEEFMAGLDGRDEYEDYTLGDDDE